MVKYLFLLMFFCSCSSDLNEKKLISIVESTNKIDGWDVTNVSVTSIVDRRGLGKESCYDVKYSYELVNSEGCYQRGTNNITNNDALNFLYKVIQHKKYQNLYEKGACWTKKNVEQSINQMKNSNQKLLGKVVCLDKLQIPFLDCKKSKKIDQEYIDELNDFSEEEIYKDINSWKFIERNSKTYQFKKHHKVCYKDEEWFFKN